MPERGVAVAESAAAEGGEVAEVGARVGLDDAAGEGAAGGGAAAGRGAAAEGSGERGGSAAAEGSGGGGGSAAAEGSGERGGSMAAEGSGERCGSAAAEGSGGGGGSAAAEVRSAGLAEVAPAGLAEVAPAGLGEVGPAGPCMRTVPAFPVSEPSRGGLGIAGEALAGCGPEPGRASGMAGIVLLRGSTSAGTNPFPHRGHCIRARSASGATESFCAHAGQLTFVADIDTAQLRSSRYTGAEPG